MTASNLMEALMPRFNRRIWHPTTEVYRAIQIQPEESGPDAQRWLDGHQARLETDR